MDLLKEIVKLNENSREEDIMKIVEYDFKALACMENIDYRNIVDKNDSLKYSNSKGINSIYNWFNWRNINSKINPNGEKWKKEFAPDSTYSCKNLKKIYQEFNLGWWDSIPKFSCDTINSFLTTYSYALKIFYPDNFTISNNNSVEFNSYKENDYTSQKKLLNEENGNFKFKEYDKVNNLPCIQELARLTHSFGNFMPCPISPYNTVKGCSSEIKDFLDLIIIKIQEKKDIKYSVYENKKYISQNTNSHIMGTWKEWFDDNREKLLIDYKDYQLLSSIDDIKNMDNDSFVEIVSKINNRIRVRGLRMIKEINTCKEVKLKCEELINILKSYF